MSDPTRPDEKPPGSPTPGGTGTRGTVGVYDRPASADRPSRLPKIITAIIVVVMLIATWLFWPKSAAAALRPAPAPAAAVSVSGPWPSGTPGPTPPGAHALPAATQPDAAGRRADPAGVSLPSTMRGATRPRIGVAT